MMQGNAPHKSPRNSKRNRQRNSPQAWLQTSLGQSLLQHEARLVEDGMDGVFGEYCLQLGLWGEPHAFVRFARTQRSALITERGASASALGQLHRLPLASDSIDSLILPHTLDFSDRPHAILREVHRVLRAGGHLIVLGFRPGGLWGLWRFMARADLPAGMVSDRRLRDWMTLLDMNIHRQCGYFFRLPLAGRQGATSPLWERRGERWWPELAACYMLSAQKRISTLTPVRPVWQRKPKLVAGLAEPATRVARIRFARKPPSAR